MIVQARGIGDIASSMVALVSVPGQMALNSLSDVAANIYETVEYGTIPTLESMGTTIDEPSMQLSTDYSTVAQGIQNFEDTGAYNPAGNLPIDASGNLSDDPSTWVIWIIGGVAIYFGLKVLRVF